MSSIPVQLPADITAIVRLALAEDIGSGDITANLIDAGSQASAQIICKEEAILCGNAWLETTFKLLDPELQLNWLAKEGQRVLPGHMVVNIQGAARSILTGERTALNFLQTLSGTATASKYYADLVAHTGVILLDTRKTLPGLRTAQKYAVRIGGCHNHRMGLYDAFLIKENHIATCGGVAAAIKKARALGLQKPVQIEVQNLLQLAEAIATGADVVMLDNFSLDSVKAAVELNQGQVKLEVSGGIDQHTLVKIAETGVDYVSIGSLTKHCKAIDFSLLIDQ